MFKLGVYSFSENEDCEEFDFWLNIDKDVQSTSYIRVA